METIRVKIVPNRELFRDDDTGFKIYSADVREADGEVEYNNYGNISVKGDNLPDFNIGSLYDIDIAKNPRDKYKGSYSMVKSHYVKPQTAEEQWKFLSMIVTENQYVSISRVYSAEEDKIIDIITNDEFDYEIYLTLSVTTKYKDLINIAEKYEHIKDWAIIFTKLDETCCLGNMLNMKLFTGAPLSYTTSGQNVPNDIEVINEQGLAKLLLGGNS